MAKKKKIIIPIVILIAVIGVVVYYLFLKEAPLEGVITGSGTIEATEVDIASRLSGEILRLNVSEGDSVNKGDILFEIKASELNAQRMGAEALFNEAKANLTRTRNLYNSGGIARMELDRAETAYLQAKSQLEIIDVMLGDSVVVAPISGVVLTKNMEAGELASPGVPIITLADLSRVWINIYVGEPVMGLIDLGDEAKIGVDSYPEREFPGKVTYISDEPEFTPKNIQTKDERTKLVFAVKIELDNPDLALKPGMPADAEIRLTMGN